MELLFRKHLDNFRREALGIGNGTTLGNGLGIGNRDGALLGEILVDGAALAKALGIGDGVALGETLERADDGSALGDEVLVDGAALARVLGIWRWYCISILFLQEECLSLLFYTTTLTRSQLSKPHSHDYNNNDGPI
eukprot:scaffold11470_cov99-Cylindrotheca_fusiformis.AAC.2